MGKTKSIIFIVVIVILIGGIVFLKFKDNIIPPKDNTSQTSSASQNTSPKPDNTESAETVSDNSINEETLAKYQEQLKPYYPTIIEYDDYGIIEKEEVVEEEEEEEEVIVDIAATIEDEDVLEKPFIDYDKYTDYKMKNNVDDEMVISSITIGETVYSLNGQYLNKYVTDTYENVSRSKDYKMGSGFIVKVIGYKSTITDEETEEEISQTVYFNINEKDKLCGVTLTEENYMIDNSPILIGGGITIGSTKEFVEEMYGVQELDESNFVRYKNSKGLIVIRYKEIPATDEEGTEIEGETMFVVSKISVVDKTVFPKEDKIDVTEESEKEDAVNEDEETVKEEKKED